MDELCSSTLPGEIVGHVAVICHKQSPSNCCSVTAVGENPASCNASWEMLSAVTSNSRRWERHTEEGGFQLSAESSLPETTRDTPDKKLFYLQNKIIYHESLVG